MVTVWARCHGNADYLNSSHEEEGRLVIQKQTSLFLYSIDVTFPLILPWLASSLHKIVRIISLGKLYFQFKGW